MATDSTGPKISSLKMRIAGETPSKMVGSMKNPCDSASGRLPPVTQPGAFALPHLDVVHHRLPLAIVH